MWLSIYDSSQSGVKCKFSMHKAPFVDAPPMDHVGFNRLPIPLALIPAYLVGKVRERLESCDF